jgi:hypothetical protein
MCIAQEKTYVGDKNLYPLLLSPINSLSFVVVFFFFFSVANFFFFFRYDVIQVDNNNNSNRNSVVRYKSALRV